MRRRWLGGRRFAALLVLAGTFLVLLPRTALADPSASVGDSTLSWDQTTSLRGSGFLPGAQVQVVLYPNSVILATTTVNGDGSVSTSIRAPHVNSGKSYVLGVQGQMANGVYGGAQVPITIVGPTPTVSVSSTHLHWGDQPVVSGALWHPGTSVRISLLGSGDIGSGSVGSNGDFAATVTIPSQLKSATSYQIVATGEGIDGLFHLVNAQVTIEGTRPSMALSTTTAPRGSKLTVSGRLWLKGTSVLVTLVPGFEKLGTFPVADDGTFSATVTIPAKAGGNDPHAIVVTGTGTDGLFAYLLTRLDLGGTAPKGTTTANAIGIDENTPPPPGVDLHVGGTPGTVALNDKGTGNGVSAKLLLVAVIILLTLATAAVIALTARRDVRRNLHVQRVRLQRRFSRRA
jgi:hypothetical protein